MPHTKTIVVIGASDELTAHLRLLMRKAAPELSHTWVWGEEAHADLVVVDPNEFAGHMARDRTVATGVPCAALVSDPDDAGQAIVLQLPLKTARVVAVLNAAAASVVDLNLISHDALEFYERVLGEDVPMPASFGEYSVDIWGEHRLPPAPVQGLDEVLRREPAPDAPSRGALPMDVEPGRSEFDHTLRSEKRAEVAAETRPAGRAPVPDPIRQPFRAYLEGDLLWRASQAQIEGAPALILDPKRRLYFAEGELSALQPYLQTPPARREWVQLPTQDMSQHTLATGRPFMELLWLDAMLKANGRLASHLDPGGSYRLKQRIEVDPCFHSHGAIADAMREPARLHEITAASGAPMEQVFNLVNAYDSIGFIESQPRERLRSAPVAPAPEPETHKGLLGRLKWPFGKG